jgi:deazaflavin-dependent oxidoreductase (nitroreductase family)
MPANNANRLRLPRAVIAVAHEVAVVGRRRDEVVQIAKNVQPPTGLTRLLFRVPIYLYRAGVGWIFGQRILLLRHVGRISGKQRQAILEVAEHDPADDSYVVASGWGPTAAWYRNVVHTPEVTIQVGRRTIPAMAVKLTEDEGAEIFARYGMKHRRAAKYLLPRMLGFSVDGSEADFRAVGRHLPFIRFIPRA